MHYSYYLSPVMITATTRKSRVKATAVMMAATCKSCVKAAMMTARQPRFETSMMMVEAAMMLMVMVMMPKRPRVKAAKMMVAAGSGTRIKATAASPSRVEPTTRRIKSSGATGATAFAAFSGPLGCCQPPVVRLFRSSTIRRLIMFRIRYRSADPHRDKVADSNIDLNVSLIQITNISSSQLFCVLVGSNCTTNVRRPNFCVLHLVNREISSIKRFHRNKRNYCTLSAN
jgi:hypothetical protein